MSGLFTDEDEYYGKVAYEGAGWTTRDPWESLTFGRREGYVRAAKAVRRAQPYVSSELRLLWRLQKAADGLKGKARDAAVVREALRLGAKP